MTVTIDDIAEKTGYHRTTVSQVLRGDNHCYASVKTKELIRNTAERMDYVPNHFARSLREKRSRTIGVVLSAAEVAGAQLRSIAEALFQNGYMPLFSESFEQPGTEARAIQALRQHGVDGLILNANYDDDALSRMLPRNLPAVLIRNAPVQGHPCVVADRARAFAAGVRRLADRGHQRIALVGLNVNSSTRLPWDTTRHKVAGYRLAMRALGLFDERLLIDCGPLAFGEAYDYVAEHRERFEGVSAILTTNDRLAIEIMAGLATLGIRVPEDCSVVGFDDTEFAVAVRPRLTTFDPRRAEVGTKAVEMLLKLIAGETVRTVTVVPKLIERESTGAFEGGR